MRWDLILAGMSVILGVPSIIALFLSGQQALAAFGVIAAVGFLGGALYLRRRLNEPAISVDFQKFTIRFQGGRATADVAKQYEFRVHRAGLSHWVHRNISADGAIQNLAWDGIPIPPADLVSRCNCLEVTTRNPYPWPTGKKLHGRLTYELQNAFGQNVEYVGYNADMPTKLAVMRIEFSQGDRCTSAYVQRRANGITETLDIADRDPNGTWVQVEIRKPKGGHEYTLFWHW